MHHQVPFDQITLIPSDHSSAQKIYHQTFNPLIKDVYTPPIYLGLIRTKTTECEIIFGGKKNQIAGFCSFGSLGSYVNLKINLGHEEEDKIYRKMK